MVANRRSDRCRPGAHGRGHGWHYFTRPVRRGCLRCTYRRWRRHEGVVTGLFYGGGLSQLWTQTYGIIAVALSVFVVSMGLMYAVKATGTLRVSRTGELERLDIHEHGSPAYPEFATSFATASAAAGQHGSAGTPQPSPAGVCPFPLDRFGTPRRPWGPPAGLQQWHRLLLLHQPAPAGSPRPLELDLYEVVGYAGLIRFGRGSSRGRAGW